MHLISNSSSWNLSSSSRLPLPHGSPSLTPRSCRSTVAQAALFHPRLSTHSRCPPFFHFFLLLLSAVLRHFLSGLCQEGMLTTPGIAALWECTPLKVFLSSPPFLSSFSPLSLVLQFFCTYFSPSCFFFFLFWHQLCFFSSIRVHTDTHQVLPPPPLLSCRSVSGATPHRPGGEHPHLSWANLTVSRTLRLSSAPSFFPLCCFYCDLWDMWSVLYWGLMDSTC